MWEWIKNHIHSIIMILTILGFLLFCYSCEPKVQSLFDRNRMVNRQELQLELDQIIGLAQLRMLDLDKQEQLRSIVLQNALVLVQGQPFNPVGLITAIAGIYGIMQAGSKVTKGVKNIRNKRKGNNATG